METRADTIPNRFKPGDLFKEHVLGPYGVMLVATTVANVINYFFAIIIGRLLGPDTYSAYASLIGVSMVLTVAAGTFMTVIARYVAADEGRGDEANAKYFAWRALGVMSALGIAGLAVMLAMSWPLSTWLKIGAIFPCVLLAIRVALGFIHPVPMGTLQGLQDFNLFAVAMVAWAVARFVFGVGLVAIGLGLNGAMVGDVVGALAVVLLPLFWLRKWYSSRPREGRIDTKHMTRYVPAVIVATACTAAFMAIDIILVRGLIGGEAAGFYAGAQKMGTIVYFLPGAVAMVMFPKVSANTAREVPSWRTLVISITITGCLCGFVAILFAVFPSQLLKLMFGEEYLGGAHLVPILSIAMFCFSLVAIMTFFFLGTEHFNFVYILGLGLVLEVVGIVVFHGNIGQVAWIVGATGIWLALAMGVFLFNCWKKEWVIRPSEY